MRCTAASRVDDLAAATKVLVAVVCAGAAAGAANLSQTAATDSAVKDRIAVVRIPADAAGLWTSVPPKDCRWNWPWCMLWVEWDILC